MSEATSRAPFSFLEEAAIPELNEAMQDMALLEREVAQLRQENAELRAIIDAFTKLMGSHEKEEKAHTWEIESVTNYKEIIAPDTDNSIYGGC